MSLGWEDVNDHQAGDSEEDLESSVSQVFAERTSFETLPSAETGYRTIDQKAAYQYDHFGSIKAISSGEPAQMKELANTDMLRFIDRSLDKDSLPPKTSDKGWVPKTLLPANPQYKNRN
ncbi:MAG: hypothetical protein Q9182_000587 [Xanthomendoza sp. 2 TL-2023]